MVTFDADGDKLPANTDVIIAVYGEDPYAEFRGDRENVDFVPNDFDASKLKQFKDAGIPVVSVFLSGRPLWTNPEINMSDAFIASWLPGSEPAGITDLLFQTNPLHDFTGRLSFSWPKLATQVRLNSYHPDYDPLFKVGYGLNYQNSTNLAVLPEDSGLSDAATGPKGIFFEKGNAQDPWRFTVAGAPISIPFNERGIKVTGFDKSAQEDAVRIQFSEAGQSLSISSQYTHDFQRETNGAMELSFEYVTMSSPDMVQVGMNSKRVDIPKSDEWREIQISLSCFDEMDKLKHALVIEGGKEVDLAIANVKLVEESSAGIKCP